MFSIFIKRPVLAIVISLVIIFMGVLAINTLPTSQFPSIAPPRVVVSVAYPGASADVLVKSVLIPMEKAVNGGPGMKYMTSDDVSAGEANIQAVSYTHLTKAEIIDIDVADREHEEEEDHEHFPDFSKYTSAENYFLALFNVLVKDPSAVSSNNHLPENGLVSLYAVRRHVRLCVFRV